MQLGADVLVKRNDEISVEQIEALNPEAIVLSPGPGEPQDAGNMMQVIAHFCDSIPILGICLGMQALGIYFGGELKRAVYPMHGKVSKLNYSKHPMFNDIPLDLEVCRYHSLIIENITDPSIELVARSEIGELMAFAHKDLKLWGLQFHPEAILTPNGKTILANWIKLINLH